MPKDTKTLGNNKARAWESLGFAHKKRLCQRFDTTSVNPKTIPMKHCVSFQIKIYVLTMNKFIMCDTIFIELLSIQ